MRQQWGQKWKMGQYLIREMIGNGKPYDTRNIILENKKKKIRKKAEDNTISIVFNRKLKKNNNKYSQKKFPIQYDMDSEIIKSLAMIME